MAKLKLLDVLGDDVIIKRLKKDYKMLNRIVYSNSMPGWDTFNEKETMAAIATLLQFYMVYDQATAWLEKQDKKRKV